MSDREYECMMLPRFAVREFADLPSGASIDPAFDRGSWATGGERNELEITHRPISSPGGTKHSGPSAVALFIIGFAGCASIASAETGNKATVKLHRNVY